MPWYIEVYSYGLVVFKERERFSFKLKVQFVCYFCSCDRVDGDQAVREGHPKSRNL